MHATIWHNPACGTSRKTLAILIKGSPAEALGLTNADVSPEAILDAMLREPILINRPLVETAKGVRLCRPQERVHEIL